MGKQYSKDQIVKFKEKIINEISKGKSLRAILRKNKELPSRRYCYQWLNPEDDKYDANFSNQYTRARNDSADLDVERMEKIVRDIRSKKLTPQQGRAMADILKWTAGKKKPKKYGDQLDVTSGGEPIDGITVVIPDNGRIVKTSE